MDRAERNRLIEENLPLVGYLVADVWARATHLSREDLASVGSVALVTAADAFNPALGVPFGAFARRRILGAFADEMRSMDWASRGIRKRIKETLAVQETLTAGLGRTPSVAELATAMGTDRATVAETLADAARTVTTLDDPSAQSIASQIPLPDESIVVGERLEVLQTAIDALPERMRAIVRDVYFNDRPIKEIAAELGISHSAVSQQRSEAVRLLHDALAAYFAEKPGTDLAVTARVSAASRAAYFTRMAQHANLRVADVFRQHVPAV
ncbi:sigma-70 family RNA polymerase sigma factor [Paramicrobacterium agarici]|uniref:RNA polymerase sigma factor for flagellar operon FliA n=1 Tax=Paramicrobacterium agarici TaxID=630514 RepID=A0A2A9DV08_9MICO|nr:sigma-70 family RNA polymerase sigma factor [Microbacterium agarici]PFG30617.1 RNA polymerase sigma factor for flagellar operon FliA [Microbacterium agarici]TQO23635.1 RNA polymerase sigma factor for flagellar operon FliA [Microbacterium agarici]